MKEDSNRLWPSMSTSGASFEKLRTFRAFGLFACKARDFSEDLLASSFSFNPAIMRGDWLCCQVNKDYKHLRFLQKQYVQHYQGYINFMIIPLEIPGYYFHEGDVEHNEKSNI